MTDETVLDPPEDAPDATEPEPVPDPEPEPAPAPVEHEPEDDVADEPDVKSDEVPAEAF